MRPLPERMPDTDRRFVMRVPNSRICASTPTTTRWTHGRPGGAWRSGSASARSRRSSWARAPWWPLTVAPSPGAGHSPTPPTRGCSTPEAANLMFSLVSARYEHASLIATSNKPFCPQLLIATLHDLYRDEGDAMATKRIHGRVARRRGEVKCSMRGCAGMYVDSGSSPKIRMAEGDARLGARCDQTIPAAGSAMIPGDGAARAHQGQRRPGG
jgi:hypothetical protein